MSIFNVGPAVIKTINNSYNPTLSILELKELFANRNKGNINQKKTNDTIIELIEKYIETLQVSPLTNTRYGPANVTCWESLFRCFLLYNDSVKDFLKVTTFKKYVQEYLASVNQDIKWVSSSQSQCKNCNILTKNLQDKEDLLKEKLLNYSNSKRLVSQIHDSQSLVSQIHDSQGLVSQINDSQTQRLVSQTHGSQSLVSQTHDFQSLVSQTQSLASQTHDSQGLVSQGLVSQTQVLVSQIDDSQSILGKRKRKEERKEFFKKNFRKKILGKT